MSLILDALRRKSPERGGPGDPRLSGDDRDPERNARADAVLATLGYARPAGRGGTTLKALLIYGVIALATGFATLSLLIFLLAPSTAPAPAPAPRVATAAPAAPLRHPRH